jgi:hypothetical protein
LRRDIPSTPVPIASWRTGGGGVCHLIVYGGLYQSRLPPNSIDFAKIILWPDARVSIQIYLKLRSFVGMIVGTIPAFPHLPRWIDMASLTSTALKAKLSTLAKQSLSSPLRIGDGRGLHLLVKPNQGASGAWVLRYTFAGKRKDMGLGAYPTVGLAEVRQAVEEAHALLRSGVDPLAARQARKEALARSAQEETRKAITFREAALETMAAKRGGWSNTKHAAQWLATLEQHAFPQLGALHVAEVNLPAVLGVLRPIWPIIPETRAGENPARWRGLLSEELPPPRRVRRVVHRPALPWQQLPEFWIALSAVEGMGALALRFAILTAARTGEVRGMTWREVDLDAALWTDLPP